MLQVGGESCGEFLPGEEFEARGERGCVDGCEDGIPDLDEVVAAGVAEDAEPSFGGVGGEDVADELVAGDAGFGGTGGEVEEGIVGEVGGGDGGSLGIPLIAVRLR